MALDSESTTHVLLTGPPASAKTMFLTPIMRQLKNSYFTDGANSTQAGMIDYVFGPDICLSMKLIKWSQRIILLNLMDTGIGTGTKYGKTRLAQINTSVLQQALLSVRYVAWMLSELWAL